MIHCFNSVILAHSRRLKLAPMLGYFFLRHNGEGKGFIPFYQSDVRVNKEVQYESEAFKGVFDDFKDTYMKNCPTCRCSPYNPQFQIFAYHAWRQILFPTFLRHIGGETAKHVYQFLTTFCNKLMF